MEKEIKSFRLSDITLEQLNELKTLEDAVSTENRVSKKSKGNIIEDAVDFYYNYKTDRKKSYGFAPALERTMQTTLKEYMDPLIDFLNHNQYHIYYIERLAKLILYSTDLAGDESEMINILNGEPLFEKVIKDDIIEKEGIKK